MNCRLNRADYIAVLAHAVVIEHIVLSSWAHAPSCPASRLVSHFRFFPGFKDLTGRNGMELEVYVQGYLWRIPMRKLLLVGIVLAASLAASSRFSSSISYRRTGDYRS